MALDKKNRVELIITVSLIPVLFFILYSSFSGAKNRQATLKPPAQTQALMPIVSARQDAVEKLKDLNWGRDPFMFGTAKDYSEGEAGLVLNGIAWDEKTPSAIINNKVVKAGDEVAGNKVADIQKERVIVTKDGNSYELNLRQKAGQ